MKQNLVLTPGTWGSLLPLIFGLSGACNEPNRSSLDAGTGGDGEAHHDADVTGGSDAEDLGGPCAAEGELSLGGHQVIEYGTPEVDDFTTSCETEGGLDWEWTFTAPEDGIYSFELDASWDPVSFALFDQLCGGEELQCARDNGGDYAESRSVAFRAMEAGETVVAVVNDTGDRDPGDTLDVSRVACPRCEYESCPLDQPFYSPPGVDSPCGFSAYQMIVSYTAPNDGRYVIAGSSLDGASIIITLLLDGVCRDYSDTCVDGHLSAQMEVELTDGQEILVVFGVTVSSSDWYWPEFAIEPAS